MSMLNGNKAQMRIVEAMITCTILVAGLSVSIYISNVYTMMERGNIEKTATNIMSVLGDPEVIEKIVNNEGFWQLELMGLLQNLLPPDTFYHISISSALTGDLIGEITNLAGSYNSSEVDSATVKSIVTISLPLSRTVYIPLDVMLVIDVSGSMNDRLPGDVKTKIEGAKEAANLFVDQLNSSRDKVGLVSFSTTPTLRQPLTDNFAAVETAINALVASGYTNIGGGINYSAIEFQTNGRSGETVWATVLLSDGKANRPTGVNATQYALDRARDAYVIGSAQNLRIYTIGLGAKDDINEVLLEQIAEGPLQGIPSNFTLEGQYYYAPSAEELSDIYLTIAKDLMFDVQYDVVVIELTLIQPR